MSNFDTNKYRIKYPAIAGSRGIGTKAYPRVEALNEMAKFLTLGKIVVKTFDNKKISAQHRKALQDCSIIWNRLSELEKQVTERAKKIP